MNKQITNIVFTKNRPLQLEGYLESLYNHFTTELIQTYVIYKPELFDNEYQHVFQKYSSCIVVKETNFSTDFFEILNQISTKYILFGVDDVVYFDSVDFDLIDKIFQRKDWNCRWSQNHAEQLPTRIYFQKLRASAIQVNMVNTSARAEFNCEKIAGHLLDLIETGNYDAPWAEIL